jgi:hypothetical protein
MSRASRRDRGSRSRCRARYCPGTTFAGGCGPGDPAVTGWLVAAGALARRARLMVDLHALSVKAACRLCI